MLKPLLGFGHIVRGSNRGSGESLYYYLIVTVYGNNLALKTDFLFRVVLHKQPKGVEGRVSSVSIVQFSKMERLGVVLFHLLVLVDW